MATLCQMPAGIGHPIINPFGQIILISQGALRALDMRGYLQRDNESGLKGMDARRWLVYLEMERETAHFKEIGRDCSGPNVVKCRCEDCKEKISDDPITNDIRTRQAVRW